MITFVSNEKPLSGELTTLVSGTINLQIICKAQWCQALLNFYKHINSYLQTEYKVIDL